MHSLKESRTIGLHKRSYRQLGSQVKDASRRRSLPIGNPSSSNWREIVNALTGRRSVSKNINHRSVCCVLMSDGNRHTLLDV